MRRRLCVPALALGLCLGLALPAGATPHLTRDQAKGAIMSHVISSGSCGIGPTSVCNYRGANLCRRYSSREVSCKARYGGRTTDPMTGETTGTFECDPRFMARRTDDRFRVTDFGKHRRACKFEELE